MQRSLQRPGVCCDLQHAYWWTTAFRALACVDMVYSSVLEIMFAVSYFRPSNLVGATQLFRKNYNLLALRLLLSVEQWIFVLTEVHFVFVRLFKADVGRHICSNLCKASYINILFHPYHVECVLFIDALETNVLGHIYTPFNFHSVSPYK